MAGRLGGHSRGARRGAFSSLFESTWPFILSQDSGHSVFGRRYSEGWQCGTCPQGMSSARGRTDGGSRSDSHSLLPALGGTCEVGLGSLQPGA